METDRKDAKPGTEMDEPTDTAAAAEVQLRDGDDTAKNLKKIPNEEQEGEGLGAKQTQEREQKEGTVVPAAREPAAAPERVDSSAMRMMAQVRHARTHYVGKYHSCMI